MTLPVTISGALALQYESAPGAWTTVATCDLGSVLRTRRLGSPPGQAVAAQKWRVVKIGARPWPAGPCA